MKVDENEICLLIDLIPFLSSDAMHQSTCTINSQPWIDALVEKNDTMKEKLICNVSFLLCCVAVSVSEMLSF